MKLFVLDLMNLAMRAFHGFQKSKDGLLSTSDGKLTFVCYGVALSINKILQDYQPDALVVCTDSKGHTFRHEMYPLYKSNRKASDDTFVVQIPDLFEMINKYQFKLLKQEATEADDIIGSIVKKFAGTEYNGSIIEVVVVSGDKDFMQLVGPHCTILKPENMGTYRIVDKNGVLEKFGVLPNQVIDALAIIGDAVDMVPGVAGIGEKGAAQLLQAFGTLEGVYQNINIIKPALQAKLLKSADNAFMSKKLVTINKDIPLDVSFEDLKIEKNILSNPELRQWFAKMEFRSFLFEGAELIGDSGSRIFDDKCEDAL